MIEIEFIDDLPSRWSQPAKDDDDGSSSVSSLNTWATEGSASEPAEPNHKSGLLAESEEQQPQHGRFCRQTRSGSSSSKLCMSIMKKSRNRESQRELEKLEETTKGVRFDMKATKVHNRFDCFEMSECEFNASYYKKDEIRQFYANAINDFQSMFVPKAARRSSVTMWFAAPTCKFDVKETVLDAYSTCERAKSEKAMKCAGDLIHREALKEIYTWNDLVGLEKFILQAVREQSKNLCKMILEYEINSTRGRRTRDDTQEETLLQVYQTMSRPSRLLSQEFAQAIHASLL